LASYCERASNEELAAARDDAKALLTMFAQLGEVMYWAFGRWGPGFSLIGRLSRMIPDLLGWCDHR
jgi:hypothetical protein